MKTQMHSNRIFKLNIYSIWILAVMLLTSAAYPRETDSRNSTTTLTVESLEITGNHKTKKDVILKIIKIKAGDKITRRDLTRISENLSATNFFKETSVYTQPGSARGQVIVFIEVKERGGPFFQFKSGYSELDGWYISPLGLRFDNLFGRGNYFGLELFIGDRVSGSDIAFLKPGIFQSDLNLRIALTSRNREFLHYIANTKYKQEVKNTAFSLRLNSSNGLFRFLWFEYVRESFEASETIWVAGNKDDKIVPPQIVAPFIEKKEIGRIILSLNTDTRDQKFYPTGGWWGSLSFNQASTELKSFANFKKIILDLRKYQSLYQNWVLALRIKSGWIDEEAPFYEKFYLGGPNSLRGYQDRSLNPLGYASHLFQGGAELRFPMTKKRFPRHFLTGVFFYDFGQAWNSPDQLEQAKISQSIGYGFRVKLPVIGLFRLDFAYPIPEYELKVHISLGHTF